MTLSTTLKPAKCRHCKKRLERIGQTIHEDCVDPWYQANREKLNQRALKAAQRKEREQTKARKDALKKRSQWEEECRAIVQEIARVRDRRDSCISCDLPATWDGQWHGSHYRSHGACSVLQFNLWNINKACWICNKLYSGRIGEYKPRLIAKLGAERVEWLDTQNGIFKPPIEYYVRFKKVMGKRLRRMKARL